MTKQNFIEKMAAYLLSLLFITVGLSKLLGHRDFVTTLGKSPVVNDLVDWIAYPLPLLELTVGVFLLIRLTRLYGFVASAVMMSIFTIYNIYLLKFAPDIPCSCGGIFNKLSWTNHLYINSAFTALAMTGTYLTLVKQIDKIKAKMVGALGGKTSRQSKN